MPQGSGPRTAEAGAAPIAPMPATLAAAPRKLRREVSIFMDPFLLWLNVNFTPRQDTRAALCRGEGCVTVLGGGPPRYAANPGLTPSFRRTLPETGCLSQGLPRGKCCAQLLSPKRLKHPCGETLGQSPLFRQSAPENR